jgi:hypothetical protein
MCSYQKPALAQQCQALAQQAQNEISTTQVKNRRGKEGILVSPPILKK